MNINGNDRPPYNGEKSGYRRTATEEGEGEGQDEGALDVEDRV